MLERDIQKSCINRLDVWKQICKVVIHYEDMSGHGKKFIRGRWVMHSKKGSPDLVAYIKYKETCCICFFEIKRPQGKQSEDQIKFMLKFSNLTNVYYDVITEPNQIDHRIESITNYYQNQINELGM